MDSDLRHSMLRYYDERASEYEDAYLLGTGTASIPDPDVFRREAALLTGRRRTVRARADRRSRVWHRTLAAALRGGVFEHHAHRSGAAYARRVPQEGRGARCGRDEPRSSKAMSSIMHSLSARMTRR